MKINKYYGAATLCTLAGAAVLTGIFKQHDNAVKNNYFDRLQNMEYVKTNANNKYIETLEIVNKFKASRINSEYIDDLWKISAAAVKDSIELTKKIK